jgi:hypothetical protein
MPLAPATAEPASRLDLDVSDVEDVLRRRNPQAPNRDIDEISRLVETVTTALLSLSRSRRRRLAGHADDLASTLVEVLDRLDAQAQPGLAESSPAPFEGPLEFHEGKGLGGLLSRQEGLRRLDAITLRMEDWTGPVAGPGELESRLGIARSTLQDWRRAGSVIGLLKGTRKHVFPLAQFVDGRPVEGLAQLQAIIGNARSAWLWLVEPMAGGRPAPLERLKRGEIGAVMALARENFA